MDCHRDERGILLLRLFVVGSHFWESFGANLFSKRASRRRQHRARNSAQHHRCSISRLAVDRRAAPRRAAPAPRPSRRQLFQLEFPPAGRKNGKKIFSTLQCSCQVSSRGRVTGVDKSCSRRHFFFCLSHPHLVTPLPVRSLARSVARGIES